MSIYTKMVVSIIEAQEGIIGPLALEQAQKVPGLKIDWEEKEIVIEGEEKEIINTLVKQYEHFFGKASVEACKDAVRGLIKEMPQEGQVPDLLR